MRLLDAGISFSKILFDKFSLVIDWLWRNIGAYIVNFILVLFIEIFTSFDGLIAILFTIYDTIGKKAAFVLLCLYLIDRIQEFIKTNINTNSQQKKSGKSFLPIVENPDYRINLFDRGIAFLAILWPLTNIFMFHLEIVRGYEFLRYIEHEYLRGLIFFLTFTPFNNALITIFVFREVVRRRGPDTKWFGQYQKYWLKHFVRYLWCYASCLNTLIQIFMYSYIKFGVANGLDDFDQENISTVFFFVIFSFCMYGGICAIFGMQPRFPLFHGACVLHVGRLKKSSK